MTNAKKVTVMGYTVFSDDLAYIPIEDKSTRVINTISPNSYGVATKDRVFDEALKNSDFLVLDGVYFAFASLLLEGRNIKRNQGPDVFYHFMNRLNADGGKAFFLGSMPKTLELIIKNAKEKYPNIKVYTYSPPFKPEFSENDNIAMVDAINKVRPDILFVGMTCPKQEKWSVANKDRVQAGLIISIGNVFDWFAGTQKPIRPIWFKLRLGWLVRIFVRPEIFKRNIGNQMKFFMHVLAVFFREKILGTHRKNNVSVN